MNSKSMQVLLKFILKNIVNVNNFPNSDLIGSKFPTFMAENLSNGLVSE